jgi:4-amino-4-deoxy-L-arabinose transferase-like glycosyltransferase
MHSQSAKVGFVTALLAIWCVGIFGRGYWTPDEPREADIAWRMSWQTDKAVPLLAGEAFCEKPPLTYWLAAMPISWFGSEAWAARLPQLLYAVITALATGLLARRSLGHFAGWAAAAAISTFLLSYQVAIWLATDAPLLSAVSVALLGAYIGFYAQTRPERLRGYWLMHAALALGFLSKSAAAWMVPALGLVTLSVWERRWRELFRWELYLGLSIQALVILTWVWFVYRGEDGLEHLKVFFWNNLVGRFTAVDAPAQVQYTTGHKNSPGKYLIELPVYLLPWTFAMAAAARRAWRQRRHLGLEGRAVRFALACVLPSLALLSLAATARNIYLAPALPGAALLLAWWLREILAGADAWDVRALRATAALLLLGVLGFALALTLVAWDSWPNLAPGVWTPRIATPGAYALISAVGLAVSGWLAIRAWAIARLQPLKTPWILFLAYCVLLVAPASQLYGQIDGWQDLSQVSRAVQLDAGAAPLILLSPDETTLAVIDMYAPREKIRGKAPQVASDAQSARRLAGPEGVILTQLPKRPLSFLRRFIKTPLASVEDTPPWIAAANLRIWKEYAVPNGRRYALLKSFP